MTNFNEEYFGLHCLFLLVKCIRKKDSIIFSNFLLKLLCFSTPV